MKKANTIMLAALLIVVSIGVGLYAMSEVERRRDKADAAALAKLDEDWKSLERYKDLVKPFGPESAKLVEKDIKAIDEALAKEGAILRRLKAEGKGGVEIYDEVVKYRLSTKPASMALIGIKGYNVDPQRD